MIDADVLDRIRGRLTLAGELPTPASVARALRDEPVVLGSATVLDLVAALQRDASGAGVLSELLTEPGVTDVLVNGAGPVHVDRGAGLERTHVIVPDEADVRRLAQRLAARAGRRLDDASPWVDARMSDGTRLHAVLAPIARPGTLISLRVPARRTFTLDELVDLGTLSSTMREALTDLVSRRRAVLVSGGTGSGKTTLLASLLALIPPDERIVVVEDSAELHPDHPHVVALEARTANVEGVGQITMRDLVRQALRMRPDRLVVGEVRGAEIVDLLAALNTGHEGGWCTIHANDAAAVPARVEALAVTAGWSREAVHSQLAAGVDAIVHVDRDRAGHRRVRDISSLVMRSDRVKVVTEVRE